MPGTCAASAIRATAGSCGSILTEEGEQLVERIPSFFEQIGKAFTVLPARELEQMRESLLRVLASDEDEGKR